MSIRSSVIEARAGIAALCMLAVLSSGCGLGQEAPPKPVKLLKTEEMYRYEGKGRNKQKVSLSRSERAKLRFEAQKKLESE